jgi:hypothetical protein
VLALLVTNAVVMVDQTQDALKQSLPNAQFSMRPTSARSRALTLLEFTLIRIYTYKVPPVRLGTWCRHWSEASSTIYIRYMQVSPSHTPRVPTCTWLNDFQTKEVATTQIARDTGAGALELPQHSSSLLQEAMMPCTCEQRAP